MQMEQNTNGTKYIKIEIYAQKENLSTLKNFKHVDEYKIRTSRQGIGLRLGQNLRNTLR